MNRRVSAEEWWALLAFIGIVWLLITVGFLNGGEPDVTQVQLPTLSTGVNE